MTMEEMIEAVKAIAEGLKADMTEQVAALDAKCGALADSVKAMKDSAGSRDRGVDTSMRRREDEDDENPANPYGARRTTADSVGRSEFAALAATVNDLRKKQTRPMRDLNAFADMQAKADAVLRTHNERAEPPMAGEDLVPYAIRMHRKMQPHSPKWKGVELQLIAADHVALENVLAEIRSDALQAGLNPVGLPEFQHREITQELPGGHKVRSWIGTGSFIKQMSRPVRHVAYIGTRNTSTRN